MAGAPTASARLSLSRGVPLSAEADLGALTLGGYLREITERFGPDEMGCMRSGEAGSMVRWSYADLWENSMEMARALVACGVDKGTRVGVLTTNRLEFFAAFFGTSLAGGIVSPLSTFSTPAELETLLQQSAVGVLILERHVLRNDFVVDRRAKRTPLWG